jgi:hypothetical protein
LAKNRSPIWPKSIHTFGQKSFATFEIFQTSSDGNRAQSSMVYDLYGLSEDEIKVVEGE